MFVTIDNNKNFYICLTKKELDEKNIEYDFFDSSFINNLVRNFIMSDQITSLLKGEKTRTYCFAVEEVSSMTLFDSENYLIAIKSGIGDRTEAYAIDGITLETLGLVPKNKAKEHIEFIKPAPKNAYLLSSANLDDIIKYLAYNPLPECLKDVTLYKQNYNIIDDNMLYYALFEVSDERFPFSLTDFCTIDYVQRENLAQVKHYLNSYKRICTIDNLKDLAVQISKNINKVAEYDNISNF